jgi:hypothetical protein
VRCVEHLRAVDEEAHVRPHPVLLVDDAEAQAWILAVEIGEQRAERVAARFHLTVVGIGT